MFVRRAGMSAANGWASALRAVSGIPWRRRSLPCIRRKAFLCRCRCRSVRSRSERCAQSIFCAFHRVSVSLTLCWGEGSFHLRLCFAAEIPASGRVRFCCKWLIMLRKKIKCFMFLLKNPPSRLECGRTGSARTASSFIFWRRRK